MRQLVGVQIARWVIESVGVRMRFGCELKKESDERKSKTIMMKRNRQKAQNYHLN
jgi:hypothetical protein